MIDLRHPDGRIAHVMLMETPVSGVIGIAQCAECDTYAALMCAHAHPRRCADEHAKDVERFLVDHACRTDAPRNRTLRPPRWRIGKGRRAR